MTASGQQRAKLSKGAKAKRCGTNCCTRLVEEGEFWMTFEDFLAQFKSLVICHMPTEALWHGCGAVALACGGPMELSAWDIWQVISKQVILYNLSLYLGLLNNSCLPFIMDIQFKESHLIIQLAMIT
ncbi:unnamed protein product [Protopolystoma xenopodis]|uniref:Calpain catalytic domain-containing protein n=1 Tax=Protopolystoma xenopodis TaxID=117903 RepID=A0A448XSQ9_9PLAT|nr:unnamed protein product [Protopolystoma xenopodis]